MESLFSSDPLLLSFSFSMMDTERGGKQTEIERIELQTRLSLFFAVTMHRRQAVCSEIEGEDPSLAAHADHLSS